MPLNFVMILYMNVSNFNFNSILIKGQDHYLNLYIYIDIQILNRLEINSCLHFILFPVRIYIDLRT